MARSGAISQDAAAGLLSPVHRRFLPIGLVLLSACGGSPPFDQLPPRDKVAILLLEGSGSSFAATDPAARDIRLHPRTLPAEPERTEGIIAEAIQQIPRWRVIDRGNGVIWATRTTRLCRFEDDVLVMLTPRGTGSTLIEARSASRLGRSDLGQNRRNLAELWAALSDTGAGPVQFR